MSGERLILFTRYPEPGRTKSRLIPRLGPEGAADLHRRMTERTLREIFFLRRTRKVEISVAYDGGSEEDMRAWLGDSLHYEAQKAGSLGDRMAVAFERAFARGDGPVILLGSDCPGSDEGYFHRAFEVLREVDVVLGPVADGGYFLIGLRRPCRKLFSEIAWGGTDVLEWTFRRAHAEDLRVRRLRMLEDVDRPFDLAVWRRLGGDHLELTPLSVIIPTLDESENISRALASAEAPGVERIVVDGGSTDGTVDVAGKTGVEVLLSGGGRAGQMNRGAEAAGGDILLFLHADTLLPRGYDDLVRRVILGEFQGGAFSLAIDSPERSYRFIERWVDRRSRWLGLVYGDQALFFERGCFLDLGGFPEQPIMEDFEIVRRMAAKSGKIALLEERVTTSSRRWRRLGFLRTTLINQMIVAAYLTGVSPEFLAHLYGKCVKRRR